MEKWLVAALAENNATRDPPLRITRLVCSFVLCRALEHKTFLPLPTLVNVYVDLLVFTRIAGTS